MACEKTILPLWRRWVPPQVTFSHLYSSSLDRPCAFGAPRVTFHQPACHLFYSYSAVAVGFAAALLPDHLTMLTAPWGAPGCPRWGVPALHHAPREFLGLLTPVYQPAIGNLEAAKLRGWQPAATARAVEGGSATPASIPHQAPAGGSWWAHATSRMGSVRRMVAL